jgi:hypothetical protein
VRLLTGSLFTLIVAAAVGLGSTYFALTRGAAFSPLTIGSWTAWPKTGTSDADPYARASIARIGRLPTALGDGVAFTASADDHGRTLDGRCDVVLAGVTPAARFWTLTLYKTDGELVANSINRSVVAPRANPGNWLPTGGVERYILVLRLYDTAVGVSTKAGREVPMPAINVRSCP